MSTTSFIVISDLHVADGHAILEGFRAPQQDALEGLLHAALPDHSLGSSSAATLIINGDCFDFLAVEPYLEDGQITPQIALEKLTKIADAHQPFFATLRSFLNQGGKIVFLPGNHDIELCFKQIRHQVTRLITGEHEEQFDASHISFVSDQSYQPLPDIYIEHGQQYDAWNYASGIWDKQGKALTTEPSHILHPLGTQYMHRVACPISIRYPYFDHFDPSIGITRQIALLSLLDPEMLKETAQRTVRMMSYPYPALQNLLPDQEHLPDQLFIQAMPDFALFQQDMFQSQPNWQATEEQLYTSVEQEQSQNERLVEVLMLNRALQKSTEEALKTIFQPVTFPEDGTTRGLHNVLRKRPELRVAIAGHTHTLRQDQFEQPDQIYLNTASWTIRYTPPVPEELNPEVIAWLRQPELERFPFQEKTSFIFAWINAKDDQPSTARLYTWEGGKNGNYRLLSI